MISIEKVLVEIEKNDRVCLQPMLWNDLYEMLPSKKRVGDGWEPGLPLILAAWWNTPVLLKKLRFREHIEWANEHSCLEEVYSFISTLDEKDWYHLGE